MRISLLLTATVVVLTSCSDADDTAGASPRDVITVFAASSLTDAFEELGRAFEEDNPSIDVKFNFLSSSDLAAQIEQGSPADVFASADLSNMERVIEAGLAASEPRVFVHNKLEIIVPPGNPADVRGLADLSQDDLVVSLCNEECPAGRYALEIFDNAGVDVEADSLESEAKAVVTRVSLGEADAGVAYVTDVRAAGGEVAGVPIPDEVNVAATYPIVALEDASDAAREFIDFVLSERGQNTLVEYGFLSK